MPFRSQHVEVRWSNLGNHNLPSTWQAIKPAGRKCFPDIIETLFLSSSWYGTPPARTAAPRRVGRLGVKVNLGGHRRARLLLRPPTLIWWSVKARIHLECKCIFSTLLREKINTHPRIINKLSFCPLLDPFFPTGVRLGWCCCFFTWPNYAWCTENWPTQWGENDPKQTHLHTLKFLMSSEAH